MPEQNDNIILSVVIGVVIVFVIVFVLAFLCGIFGLILVVPQQAHFIDATQQLLSI